MGQNAELPTHRNYLSSEFQSYQYCPTTNTYHNPQTNQTFYSQQFIFKGLCNKSPIENYYKNRKSLTENKNSETQLFKLLDYKIVDTPILKKQHESKIKAFTDRNICSISARNFGKQEFSVVLFFQIFAYTLEDEIFNRNGKKGFQEIQIWSVLSSCVLGAVNLLDQGLKEPMLSPKAIGLSKQGLIKVAQWQLIPQLQIHKNNFEEEGEVIVGETIHSKDQLSKVLLSYYWPPQGIKAMEQITNLGRKYQNIRTINNLGNQKSQIFSLGMTLISMCLKNCFYKAETYSQKYLDKLIHQAIEIRKVQGKPLSKGLEHILRSTVKWDYEDRISYIELKNIIIEHFSQNQSQSLNSYTLSQISQHSISHGLSMSNFSESISEQISKSDIKVGKYAMTTFLKASTAHENESKHINIPLSNIANEIEQNSFGSGNLFQGSGAIQQGIGDQSNQYEPEQIQQQIPDSNNKQNQKIENLSIDKKIKNSSRSSNSNRLKNSLISYKSVESRESYQSQLARMNSSKHTPINTGRGFNKNSGRIQNNFKDQIVKPMSQDIEDQNQSIFELLEVNFACQQNPDLFQQIYQQEIYETDRTYKTKRNAYESGQSPHFPQNTNFIPNAHQIKQTPGFGILDSPIYQGINRSEYDECSLYENINKQSKGLFTDPKLMQYILSPISSFQNTLNTSVKVQKQKHSHLNKQKTLHDKQNYYEGNRLQKIKNQAADLRGLKNSNQKQHEWIRVETLESAEVSNNSRKADNTHRIVKEEMSSGFYEGEKKNGIRSGYGVFYYNQGGKYHGNWLNNKMHGKGTLQYGDGRIAYQGQWYADQLHGWGILYNESPINNSRMIDYRNLDNLDEYWVYYDGQFQYDDKSGKGILIMTNGQQFKGTFKQDFADGYGQYYRLNGEIIKGVWQKNMLVGKSD